MEDIQVECPVCGFAYSREEEAEYIEGYGMCYHCFCEFDDELADYEERVFEKGIIMPLHFHCKGQQRRCLCDCTS